MHIYLEHDAENPEVEIRDLFGDERISVKPEAAVAQRYDTKHQIVGRAEDDRWHHDGHDGDPCPVKGADTRADRRMTDGEVSEDCQRHCQPHGGRVGGDVQAIVEQKVADPAGRVTAVLVGTSVAVEVRSVRDVEDHRQQIGDVEIEAAVCHDLTERDLQTSQDLSPRGLTRGNTTMYRRKSTTRPRVLKSVSVEKSS